MGAIGPSGGAGYTFSPQLRTRGSQFREAVTVKRKPSQSLLKDGVLRKLRRGMRNDKESLLNLSYLVSVEGSSSTELVASATDEANSLNSQMFPLRQNRSFGPVRLVVN
jgi:hypothetical protein